MSHSPQYSPHSPQYSPHSPQSPVVSEPYDAYAGLEESSSDFYARMRNDLDTARIESRRLRHEEVAARKVKAQADETWSTARDTVDNCTATLKMLPMVLPELMQGAMYIYKDDCCYAGADVEEKVCNGIKRKRSDARDVMDKARKTSREKDAMLHRLSVELAVANANVSVLQHLL